MNINRHNYEEFFLLLADGELSAAEQESVLAFVKLHPDLEEELELLIDCKLEAETAPVFPKEKLLKLLSWNLDEPEPLQIQLLTLLDDELSSNDRKALEEKIEKDPVLKSEWETIKRFSKIQPPNAPSFPKEKLYKATAWNIEEPETVFVQMLSLVDNELSDDQKVELEKRIAADPLLQLEWQSLQKARLPAETVIFENKAILYRKAEGRRILPFIRWAAAAAILIGFGWYLLPKLLQHQQPELVGKENYPKAPAPPTKNPAPKKDAPVNEQPAKTEELASRENKAAQTTKANLPTEQESGVIAAKSVAQNPGKKRQSQREQPPTANKTVEDQDAASRNSLAMATMDNPERQTPGTRPVITGSPNDGLKDMPVPRQLRSVPAAQQNSKSNLFTTAALTSNALEDNSGDDDIVYVAGARINKQKVRGIFRGITRSLGRSFTKSKVEPESVSSSL